MTASIRRTTIPGPRGVRLIGPCGLSGVRRDKGTGTGIRPTIPGKARIRSQGLVEPGPPRPDHTWVMDFTDCRTWAGWVYAAFIVDVYSQRITAWHAQIAKHFELMMIPLRMGLWQRGKQSRPIQPKRLRAHSDAEPHYVFLAYTGLTWVWLSPCQPNSGQTRAL